MGVRVRAAALAAGALILVGCGDGGSGSSTTTTSSVPLAATTPSSLPDAEPGSGTLVLDGVTYEFEVTGCTYGTSDGAKPGVPVTLFSLEGDGTAPGDHPFTLKASRVLVKAKADTFTDLIDLDEP